MSFCISKDYNLHKETLQFLYNKYPSEESTKIPETFGGILSNLNYAWIVRKSRVVVVNCKNGSRVGSWDFGNTLQDDSVEINNVEEIQRPNGREPHLIISLNCETRGGIICIFDFVGSKVIRAIQIVEHITNVHVIDRGQDLFSLSGPLRNFDGVLAVGTVGGNVYMLDICRQLCYEGFNAFDTRDELNPCQMHVITPENLLDIENYKKIALSNESHLAIFLNVVYRKKTEHFVLKKPDGSDCVHVNKEEVLVSALHYCPQLGSILIGYNFGAYQLWNLMCMELVYTSPVCQEHIPIIKFAIQEPADDPRAFCYVWAVYSTEDLESYKLPYLVMFALCYESKEFHENYGLLYENFQYCTVRFQRELGLGNDMSNVKSPIGGKCLRLESLILKNASTNSEISVNDGSEDALSLCIIAWKASCERGQFTYMSMFDLNQWYKAQMPNSSTSDDCSSYMITLCVSDLTNTNTNGAEVLDLNLHKKTIQQFIGTQKLEEHYYPSSLSFETSCLLEHKIVNIQCQGVQKALLSQLQTSGPLCLIRPSDTYQEIVTLGLTPLFVEVNTNLAVTTLNNQREVILNVALEQQLTSWLCKCASEWANGSFSSAGCSLDLLISWAFRRAITLKRKCDYLCVPLFDYSDDKLDANAISVLSNCIRQIKNIAFVFSFILNKYSKYLTNKDTILEQCKNLQMIEVYFDVLQWFFNVGLLPEYTPLGSDTIAHEDKIRAPYPVKELEEYYRKRRAELMLAISNKFSSKKSILFIDDLIKEECGGERLGKDWKKDGGDGFYPPRSFQALLRTYLLDGVEVCNKHSVIIYLLLDLARILDIQYKSVATHLVKFPSVFKVIPSFIKITQAFWQLDHGEAHPAIESLLDPMVNQDDLKDWHHKIAIKSLLIQEQHNLALLYMTVRKPPILDDEDILCALSLFISNNMLDEAFYLEKNFKNYTSSEKIIRHLFTECSNYGRLHSIIYRNLSNEEEKQFLKYLDDVKHPEAADLKITYFMQRSHYIEAFKTYQACEDDPMKKGLFSRLNMKARDQIVHTYKKFLPTVSYQFIESCTKEPNPTIWKEVSKPDPISVCVHKAKEPTEYKSSLILASLAKAKLTFNESQNVSLWNATTEEIPFLRTPTRIPVNRRSSVQVIIPQVVNDEEDEEDDGPSPPKRSRLSFSSPPQLYKSNIESNSSILSTPIIVRKDRSYLTPIEKLSKDITSTPTSILKVRESYNRDFKSMLSPNITSGSSNTPSRPVEQKSFISGRKSTRTSIVRFDVPTSSEEQSSSLNINHPERDSQTPERNESLSFENSSRSLSRSITPKNVSDTDDIYYSPDSSLNNIEELPKDKSNEEKRNASIEETEEFTSKISPVKPAVISKAEHVKLVDYDPSSTSKEGTDSSVPSSPPRGRKSYKKLSSDTTPVRSSPRLRKSGGSAVTERERGGSDSQIVIQEQTPSPSLFSGNKFRKSLNRQVLEANTIARLTANASSVETTTTESFEEKHTVTNVVEGHETTQTTSYIRTEHSDRTYSQTTDATLDSGSGESSEELNENVESPSGWVADTFDEELYRDLRKRHRLSQVTDRKKEISSSIVGGHMPLRITERLSRRPLEDRISFLENSQHSTQKTTEEINNEIGCVEQQIEETLMEETIPLVEVLPTNASYRLASNDNSVETKRTEISKENKTVYSDKSYIVETERTEISKENKTVHSDKSYIAETTLDSASGESYDKFDDNAESPCDTFAEDLYRDLRKRHRLSVYAGSKKEMSSEKSPSMVSVQTPSRITRRMSRRLSEERTSSAESSQQLSQKDNEVSTPNLPTEKTMAFKDIKGTGSAEKILKLNKVKCRQPLSRRVLENSVLKKIVSSYDASIVEEDISNDNIDMVEDNRKNVDEQSTSYDSFLEENAFGVLPKEKELIEVCRKSVALRNKQEGVTSDFDENEVPEENIDKNILAINTIVLIEKESPLVSKHDEQNDGYEQNNPEKIPIETTNENLDQAILEESTRENETISELDLLRQETMTPTVFERNISGSDIESSNGSTKSSKPDTNVIEISSSDEMECETCTVPSHDLNEDFMNSDKQAEIEDQQQSEDNICEQVYGDLSDDENVEATDDRIMSMLVGPSSLDPNIETSVILVSDSNNEETINEDPNTAILVQDVTAAENTDEYNKKEEELPVQDKKPLRRMTRRSSKLLDDQENETQNESVSLEQKDETNNTDLQKSSGSRRGSISRRSSQSSRLDSDQVELANPASEQLVETPKYNIRKRTRSFDVSIQSEMGESNESTLKTSGILRAKRKLRSTSVDIQNSGEEEIPKEITLIDKSKKKSFSSNDLSSSKDDQKGSKRITKTTKEDLVETYTSNRRLTRRQSVILEQSLDKVDLSVIETQDSFESLDNTDSKGTPDPQENRLNDTSPSSSASAPRSNVGRPARRLSRTNSNASDKSVTSNASSPGRRSTSSKVESPVKTGARRKLRSTSTEEKPESKSTRRVKEPTPDISDGSDTDNSVISTRSRKSTTKSDDSNSSNKRKRKVVAKTILPGIKEENLEGANGSPAQNTRNTRGKKNVQQ
ncbi:protein ELYS [Harmonia axyridis]|uniref:protein ELYS n=1 Tax=Harmonia axyridis TaxID=115357 RepID=UPI001E27998C|nr:protein ELYS [Harmonia axyridis]